MISCDIHLQIYNIGHLIVVNDVLNFPPSKLCWSYLFYENKTDAILKQAKLEIFVLLQSLHAFVILTPKTTLFKRFNYGIYKYFDLFTHRQS